MKRIFILLFALSTYCLQAQQPQGNHNQASDTIRRDGFTIDDRTVKKDINGKLITTEEFMMYMSSGDYVVDPLKKDGKIVEARLKKATPEQVEMIKKMLHAANDTISKPAPDFDVTDIKGRRYKLSTLKDKTVVLNFWYTGCAPCVAEMPVLNELVKENKDVVFLALTFDKADKVNKFLTKRAFDYAIVADARPLIQTYAINTYPTHIIIRNGQIVRTFVGFTSNIKEELQHAIDGRTNTPSPVNDKPEQMINLNSNSDIRDEEGKKLELMDAIGMVNSQRYTLVPLKDKDGKEYILVKKKNG